MTVYDLDKKKVGIIDDGDWHLISATKTFKADFKKIMKRGVPVMSAGKSSDDVIADKETYHKIESEAGLRTALNSEGYSVRD